MALTDPACKNAKPKEKPYKLSDAKGLYLLINPNGSKYFRLKYRINGKEKLLALGVYPETTLKQARQDAETAREQIKKSTDPNLTRRIEKTGATENTFKAIALEWHTKNMADKSDSHKSRVLQLLNRDLFPWLGDRPIADIKTPELLLALQRIESRNAIETAHRALQISGQILRYAEASGKIDRDFTPSLKGALAPVNGGNFAAITDPKEVGQLLRALDTYSGTFPVKTALQIAPLLFVRPGELRQMEWAHIDFDTHEWRYLVTKTKTAHIVPLSRQALALLQAIKPLTGNGRFVFPSARTPNGSRPLSDVALLAALRRMGYSKDTMSVHGFRAMARTILDEVLGYRPDFIEHQLAHAVKDPNGTSYNRTKHLEERRTMMQAWADYLDSLKNGADIITFKKAV